MKVTRRQLRRIIKEEKTKLIKEQSHMSGRNQGAMEQLYNAIDSLIALGIDGEEIIDHVQLHLDDAHGGYPEHPGQDMVETDEPAAMDEGTELDDMPDSWRQILGDHIKGQQ